MYVYVYACCNAVRMRKGTRIASVRYQLQKLSGGVAKKTI